MCKIVLSVQHLELFAVVFELSLVAAITGRDKHWRKFSVGQDSGRSLQVVRDRDGWQL